MPQRSFRDVSVEALYRAYQRRHLLIQETHNDESRAEVTAATSLSEIESSDVVPSNAIADHAEAIETMPSLRADGSHANSMSRYPNIQRDVSPDDLLKTFRRQRGLLELQPSTKSSSAATPLPEIESAVSALSSAIAEVEGVHPIRMLGANNDSSLYSRNHSGQNRLAASSAMYTSVAVASLAASLITGRGFITQVSMILFALFVLALG